MVIFYLREVNYFSMAKPDIKIEDCTLIPTYLWSKQCFACGAENKYGLQMKFYTNGEYLSSKLRLEERFTGWDQLVHGGIISTILDELMAWTVIYMTKNIMLTKSITVNYHNKILSGTEIQAFSRIEQIRDKEAILNSEIYDDKDCLCAQATGIYAVFPLKLARRLHLMSDSSIAELDKFLSAIT